MIPMSSPAKLTDAQAALLSAAVSWPDRCLVVPKTLKSGAAHKLAAKLLTRGLVREIKAKSGMEIWRRDEKIEQAYSLKLTAAGLEVIAAEVRVSQIVAGVAVPQNTDEESS